MRSLHFHLPFGMYHRACAPPIRFRLLPTLWTGDLLVPPISMLQQQLPQHLSHQLPPQHRQLAGLSHQSSPADALPPTPTSPQTSPLRLAQISPSPRFSFHFAPPLLFSVPTPSLTPFSLAKNLGCTPIETVGADVSIASAQNQAGNRLMAFLDEMHAQMPDIPDQQVQEDIEEATAAVRAG